MKVNGHFLYLFSETTIMFSLRISEINMNIDLLINALSVSYKINNKGLYIGYTID